MYSDTDFVLEGFHSFLERGVWQRVENLVTSLGHVISVVKVLVSADSSGNVHVLFHHSDAIGMNGTEIGVLEHTCEIGFSRFLESNKSLRLETEVRVDSGADGSYQSVEWGTWQKRSGLLLVPSDLSEGDSTCSSSHLSPFFDTSSSRSSLLVTGWFGDLGADLGGRHLGLGLDGSFSFAGSGSFYLGCDVLLFWHQNWFFVRVSF